MSNHAEVWNLTMTNWIKENYKTILWWCLIIALAPFFIEAIFLANLFGAEVTIGFLALLFNGYRSSINYKIQRFKEISKETANAISYIIAHHPAFQTNVYLMHSTLSLLSLLFFGSLSYAIFVWYPILIFGDTYLIHLKILPA